MRKASIVIGSPFFKGNRLFDLNDPVANRDNCLYPFHLLREAFKLQGVDLATSDINVPAASDVVIYNEMPKVLPAPSNYDKSYLILFESALIRPDNWDIDKHKSFKKIFTWNDDFVDNKKYFKINFSSEVPSVINKDLSKKSKLCTLIAGNKKVSHPLELYSKRVEAIRWFEKEHPQDFDLYGVGWDSFRFRGPKIVRALNKIKPLTKMLAPVYPSYKGMVDSKKEVLETYKFAICYENGRDIQGYITEKIFDCFFAGCVPVYWGANNIVDHIPKECFIDRCQFSSYEAMYDYMISMPEKEYIGYLDNIEKFLLSERALPFTAQFFAEVIVSQASDI